MEQFKEIAKKIAQSFNSVNIYLDYMGEEQYPYILVDDMYLFDNRDFKRLASALCKQYSDLNIAFSFIGTEEISDKHILLVRKYEFINKTTFILNSNLMASEAKVIPVTFMSTVVSTATLHFERDIIFNSKSAVSEIKNISLGATAGLGFKFLPVAA